MNKIEKKGGKMDAPKLGENPFCKLLSVSFLAAGLFRV
jgi:hypothetical protein